MPPPRNRQVLTSLRLRAHSTATLMLWKKLIETVLAERWLAEERIERLRTIRGVVEQWQVSCPPPHPPAPQPIYTILPLLPLPRVLAAPHPPWSLPPCGTGCWGARTGKSCTGGIAGARCPGTHEECCRAWGLQRQPAGQVCQPGTSLCSVDAPRWQRAGPAQTVRSTAWRHARLPASTPELSHRCILYVPQRGGGCYYRTRRVQAVQAQNALRRAPAVFATG